MIEMNLLFWSTHHLLFPGLECDKAINNQPTVTVPP